MEQYRSQNEKLDDIGRKLLEASALPEETLETIVSRPQLFASIQARIASERRITEIAPVKRSIFASWNWQMGSAFAGAVIVLAVVLVLTFATRRSNVNNDVAKADVRVKASGVQEIEQGAEPVKMPVMSNGIGPTFKPAKAVFNERVGARVAAKKVVRRIKPDRAIQDHSPREFYPLTYTGVSDETSTEAQVVRVEVPRASLYAMGIDLPVGNGMDTVKTELLISSDGVTQGIRIVE